MSAPLREAPPGALRDRGKPLSKQAKIGISGHRRDQN